MDGQVWPCVHIAEKAQRLEVFKANVVFIESVNAGTDKFWLEANQFADITDDEFRATHTGYKASVGGNKGRKTGFRYANVRLDALPTFMDWRTKGAVTPIKDQGQCGKLIFAQLFVTIVNCSKFDSILGTTDITEIS